LVPLKECALNQRIRDLKLRGATGASIVAVYRDAEAIPNPSPDTKIMPGDVLLLMGDKNQIVLAVEFLKKKIKEPMLGIRREGSPQTQSFQVPAHSRAAGKTVQELRLRRKTGATILGIQKTIQTINNPSGDVLIEEGDTLILFGWPDETEAAVQYLG
jgi:K+/H+ antiporter YhaU regulatory subunit KhtT